jgi:hypothetical protein
MAFSKELPDEILKDCHGPDDFYGPQGIMKQLARALVERTMEAELTFHPGHEKHDQGEKTLTNRMIYRKADFLIPYTQACYAQRPHFIFFGFLERPYRYPHKNVKHRHIIVSIY